MNDVRSPNVIGAPARARALSNDQKLYARHYTLLILACALEYLRPQDLISPVIGYVHIPMILTLLLLFFVVKRAKDIVFDAQLKFAMVFIGVSIAWVPFAVNNFYAFHATLNLLIYFASVLISVQLVCNNEERVKKFIKHWLVIMSVLGIIVLTHNGHGPGSFLWDENDVCSVLIAAMPFAFWARKHLAKTAAQRWLLLAIALILILAATVTRSRGGFLGLVASLLVLWWYSGKRLKLAALTLLAIVVFGSAILAILPKGYLAEMQTIEDTKDSTRLDRLKHWATAWEMYKANIVFGVGPGNYPWHHEHYVMRTKYYDPKGRMGAGRQSHSLYFTLFPELGTVGVVCYFGMLYYCWRRLNTIRLQRGEPAQRASPAIAELAGATLASTAGILVSGAFISILWYPTAWQWLMMYWATNAAYQSSLPKPAAEPPRRPNPLLQR